ncbi:Fur family transcriptional regulator [Glutamicibacter protophormiae]|uniref:Fur family ferric uptake transcriptional regulator n=1 Tax=Glutamicibacter protophormiae TaxID=37930 RepID=A0ABS4XNY4_GLUPR|nr:Fur family transcriptional regulator [Glutamicibacter protophormiae]MBP2398213.1 Fur family ferric uptake transcriptional regulator [Glutamicibacter protophormiae]QRQ78940.1 transcriptional repressor [Glutamicibacter protophormiae]WPR65014.1 Fur family transcriptional regulator [Glutamicibacter protophormiae]WPR68511.1 Fur family transcriptional regulator [Glutamicibacter protophormiae]GGL90612.1 transcriptional repressor [Glutamicibacter protophormiae]
MTSKAGIEQVLKEASMRVTQPRVAVLAAVTANPHADTETIISAVHEEHPHVSHQAVYDSLKLFTSLGVVRQIQPQGHIARYETRVGDNHHHVVCRRCGHLADVDCSVGASPCLHASDDHGFQIDEAEVIYWGICPDCQALNS